jgi:hypothetical protein
MNEGVLTVLLLVIMVVGAITGLYLIAKFCIWVVGFIVHVVCSLTKLAAPWLIGTACFIFVVAAIGPTWLANT